MGLAGYGAGVFSFRRYQVDKAQRGMSKSMRAEILLSRATKTAVHELAHMWVLARGVPRRADSGTAH